MKVAGLKSKTKQHLDGLDLSPIFKGSKLQDRPLFWHFPHYHGSGNLPSSSIRKGSYKLIRWYEDGSEELYDISIDDSEKNDISEKNPEKRTELSNELSKWLKSSGAKIPVLNKDN